MVGARRFPCLIGKNGRTFFKREGDGKSPKGQWRLERLLYRADKVRRHSWRQKPGELKKSDGWCDDDASQLYNRPVAIPFAGSHEKMWRADAAYDIVIATSHNQRPRVRGLGSAIFLHVWHEGATGTEGCVALKFEDLQKVLAACSAETYIAI